MDLGGTTTGPAAPGPAAGSAAAGTPPLPVRELRIALVCYGGVSLAIYMHGMTKEIHKLVRASAALAADPDTNPFDRQPGAGTEAVYWRVLHRLRTHEDPARRVALRVVVDIVAGTSAGGINGIFLAKALAHDLSQDGLRDLWLTEGDIARLVRGPRWLPWQVRLAGWASRPMRALRNPRTPLRGDEMSRHLHRALAGMPALGGASGTLLPPGSSLDLFVTMTDLRGHQRFVPIRGRVVADRSHAHVMRFRHEGASVRQLDDRHDRALAFAARATSSFPGAFPPVSVADFTADVGAGDDPTILERLLGASGAAAGDRTTSFFIDGGVLDNAPFGLAVDAISTKPAASQVERWLVYLEPDPATADQAAPGRAAPRPSVGGTIFDALVAIPRSEPVLDDLLRLRRLNERADRIGRLVDHYRTHLPVALADVAEQAAGLESLDQAALSALMQAAHDRARAAAGGALWAYLELELQQLADYLAAVAAAAFAYPEQSSEASFVRAVITEWMRRAHADPSTPAAGTLLNQADVPYRVRRLRFLAQALHELYPDAGGFRGDVDEAMEAAYRHLAELLAATDPEWLARELPQGRTDLLAGERIARYLAADTGPAEFVDEHEAGLRDLVAGMAEVLDARLANRALLLLEDLSARTWHPTVVQTLLVHFVGFPIWDTLLQPLLAVGSVEEFSPVRVARFAPDDAALLAYDPATGKGFSPERKLAGVGAGHFGAFFDRAGREKDYLWGRLDGAEHLLGLLADDGPDRQDLAAAMRAVLAEERPDLPKAADLIRTVTDLLEERTGPPGAG